MKILSSLITVLIIFSELQGQGNQKATDETIYIQKGKFFREYFVINGKSKPVGRHYRNLVPVMQNYPTAQKELIEGVELLESSDRYAYVLGSLLLTTQIILEQMLEREMDKYVGIAGIGLYGAMVGSCYISYSRLRKGINKVNKAIWTYNGEVYRNLLAKNKQVTKQGETSLSATNLHFLPILLQDIPTFRDRSFD